jgi:poly(A) polymerase
MSEVPGPVAGLLRLPGVGAILDLLERDGEEARIVGGAVRNALLEEPVEDIDVATTALPLTIKQRAGAAGLRTIPTGIEHGTVTVIAEGRTFEVTTLRADVETDGRHAKVAFGRDWRTDALRRDFTINALSAGRDGIVHDYAGGRGDLAARRVRFIGDPRARIREDFLRILRFFRFHAAYGRGVPDPDGLAAAIDERAGLALLSAERIRQEFLKLLAARGAMRVVTVMADCGILQDIFGGVPRTARLRKLIAVEALLSLPPDPILRLAALGTFVPEDAERLRVRMRLSNKEFDRLVTAAEAKFDLDAGEPEWRAALYRSGPEAYLDATLLAAADAPEADGARLLKAKTLPERWAVPKMPVTGADLLARGLPAGPAVGEALRAIEQRWIAADFPIEPGADAAIVDATLASLGYTGTPPA